MSLAPTFGAVAAPSVSSAGEESADAETRQGNLEIIVIASYGAEDLSVGARRTFKLTSDHEQRKVIPTTISTEQLRWRRARKHLETFLQSERQSIR